jgi:hypothetical protein
MHIYDAVPEIMSTGGSFKEITGDSLPAIHSMHCIIKEIKMSTIK